MRKLVSHDLGVYFKLFQNEAKNIADLFSIKWEFDKMGDLSVFLGHKKLKWDPVSSGTDCRDVSIGSATCTQTRTVRESSPWQEVPFCSPSPTGVQV